MGRVGSHRILVLIPAHNEAATIGRVIREVRDSLKGCDFLVIDDGSSDETPRVLRELGVETAIHLCNLGYGHTTQTGIKYAAMNRYSCVLTMDADGQHDPAQAGEMLEAFLKSDSEMMIGSRYIKNHGYRGTPWTRRVGMKLFSRLVGLFGDKRIYDTSSGLRAIRSTVFEPLLSWRFLDFHAETILYLMRLGYRVSEYPVTFRERTEGNSMYSLGAQLSYPPKTRLLAALSLVQAAIQRRTVRR